MTQPPIDNDHVADGCIPFTDDEIKQNAPSTELPSDLLASLEHMAHACSVRMDIWDRHCDLVIKAATRLAVYAARERNIRSQALDELGELDGQLLASEPSEKGVSA